MVYREQKRDGERCVDRETERKETDRQTDRERVMRGDYLAYWVEVEIPGY